MRKQYIAHIISVIFLCLAPMAVSAKAKVFYDSKSNLVGIAGHYDKIDVYNKFYEIPVDVPIPLTDTPKNYLSIWRAIIMVRRC